MTRILAGVPRRRFFPARPGAEALSPAQEPSPRTGRIGHVTLVRPPKIMSRTALNVASPTPPLALAYLSGALRATGHEATPIDGLGEALDQLTPFDELPYLVQGLTAEQIAHRVPAHTNLIGVTCMFSREWMYYRRVIQALRKHHPHVPIVVGGEHVTAEWTHLLRTCPEVDFCALGEGEETLVDLLEALLQDGDVAGVEGIAYRNEQGRPTQSPPRRRIAAIDEIPWPDWSQLPVERYLSDGYAMEAIHVRAMPMLASRGCPYECTFCSNPQMWGTRWVARDPLDVIAEMRHYKEKYGVQHIEFYDLTTVIKRSWMLQFTQALIEADLGLTWAMPSGTRSEALDAEVVANLVRSGCHRICYAPESGSEETLERIKKRVKVGRMLQSMRAAARNGMFVRANVMLGLPGQTLGEVWQSFGFMGRMALVGVNDLQLYPFTPYPGSELFNQFVAEGKIRRDDPDYELSLLHLDIGDPKWVRSWSEHFSSRALFWMTIAGLLFFYSLQFLRRPQRLMAGICRMIRGSPVTWLERMLTVQLRRLALGTISWTKRSVRKAVVKEQQV